MPQDLTALQEQIDTRRKEIQTDGYPVSVGELTNLYRDGDLDIHPEFQRFFRWSPSQKSRFVESLLLGIPIPSIFVFQRLDGVWDVIDGLQRLSTIFEFQGLLRSDDGVTLPPSVLEGTEYLPALSGLSWAGSEGSLGLTPAQQRLIKRAAVDVKIVRRESDQSAKYDLFERLNTGGSQLTDQEVRNCILIMVNRDYYSWLLDLNRNEDFQATIAISDRALAEQYDMELALRFLLLKDLGNTVLGWVGDLGTFLTNGARRQADPSATKDLGGGEFLDAIPPWEPADSSEAFREVFRIIRSSVEDQAFRRYDPVKERFLGGFSVSAFEAVTIGVYANLSDWQALQHDAAGKLRERLIEMWTEPEFRNNSGSGIRASSRLARTIPFAREHFKVS